MSLFVPPRRPSRERLDDPNLSDLEMRRSLEDLRLVHRHWGGSRALERHLVPKMSAFANRRARILDVGAGSGDVARRLAVTLREAGFDAMVVALDVQWRHLFAGRHISSSPAPAVAADAFRLPFSDGALDFAVSTLFFHHFSPEENREVLREFCRVARRGFAVLDLRRHLVPEIFVAIAGRAVFQARVSVDDGVASVRQAYTPEEALAIAREVSPGSRCVQIFPFRLLLSGGP